MIKIRFKSNDEPHLEVDYLSALVECYRSGQRKPDVLTTEDGILEIPDPQSVQNLVVKPIGNNWTTLLNEIDDEGEYICPEILEQDGRWWKKFLNVNGVESAKGVKIGIIDLGFQNPEESVNFEVRSEASKRSLPEENHGARVSRIVSDDIFGLGDGICKDAEVYFFDATFRDGMGGIGQQLDSRLISDGIRYLASVVGVDIINLSMGFPDGNYPPLLPIAIEVAHLEGCVVVSATGNNEMAPVSPPANFRRVVGVGGIGVFDTSPIGSYPHKMGSVATDTAEVISKQRNYRIFHDHNTSYGSGLNVVAPSIGITLTSKEGYVIDYEGTSYASPMVTAILALELSQDSSYARLSGESRADYAINKLKSICEDVDLTSEKKGMGIPMRRCLV